MRIELAPTQRRLRAMRFMWALLLVPVLGSGCSSTFAESSVGGSYVLRTYNMEQLPYFENVGGCSIELQDGSLHLFSDDTFEMNLTTHVEGVGCSAEAKFPKKNEGLYTSTGSSVRFSNADGSTSEGTLDFTTLTMFTSQGGIYVWGR